MNPFPMKLFIWIWKPSKYRRVKIIGSKCTQKQLWIWSLVSMWPKIRDRYTIHFDQVERWKTSWIDLNMVYIIWVTSIFFPNKEQMKTQMICSLKIATIDVTYSYWAGMVRFFYTNLSRRSLSIFIIRCSENLNLWFDSVYLNGKEEVRKSLDSPELQEALKTPDLLSYNADFEIPTDHFLFPLSAGIYIQPRNFALSNQA